MARSRNNAMRHGWRAMCPVALVIHQATVFFLHTFAFINVYFIHKAVNCRFQD
jgi:hypothetical protein